MEPKKTSRIIKLALKDAINSRLCTISSFKRELEKEKKNRWAARRKIVAFPAMESNELKPTKETEIIQSSDIENSYNQRFHQLESLSTHEKCIEWSEKYCNPSRQETSKDTLDMSVSSNEPKSYSLKNFPCEFISVSPFQTHEYIPKSADSNGFNQAKFSLEYSSHCIMPPVANYNKPVENEPHYVQSFSPSSVKDNSEPYLFYSEEQSAGKHHELISEDKFFSQKEFKECETDFVNLSKELRNSSIKDDFSEFGIGENVPSTFSMQSNLLDCRVGYVLENTSNSSRIKNSHTDSFCNNVKPGEKVCASESVPLLNMDYLSSTKVPLIHNKSEGYKDNLLNELCHKDNDAEASSSYANLVGVKDGSDTFKNGRVNLYKEDLSSILGYSNQSSGYFSEVETSSLQSFSILQTDTCQKLGNSSIIKDARAFSGKTYEEENTGDNAFEFSFFNELFENDLDSECDNFLLYEKFRILALIESFLHPKQA